MTTTIGPHKPAPASPNGVRTTPSPVGAARRNRTRIALGLVVIVVCVLATGSLFSSANKRVPVLAIRRAVPAGHTIAADDLAVVRVSAGPGIRTVTASNRERLVGRVASRMLVTGSLLAPEDVSDAARVPDGMAVVGAALKIGQYPVSLAPGDNVELIETASLTTNGDAAAPTGRGHATVIDIAQRKDSPDALAVSLLVPSATAPDVASAGVAGRLSVVVVAR